MYNLNNQQQKQQEIYDKIATYLALSSAVHLLLLFPLALHVATVVADTVSAPAAAAVLAVSTSVLL